MSNKRTSASRPRIIERWFPTTEVSAASQKGWGSSNSETLLMSWFAKRPLAQSRAAVLCSLLPWPESPHEQRRVQAIIREALGDCQDEEYVEDGNEAHAFGILDCARYDKHKGYDAARRDVIRLLEDAYPDRPAEMLDPFSGRGLIPIEAARYGQQAHAIDYLPVAVLASRLLTDWPFRDWSHERELPFSQPDAQIRQFDPNNPERLVYDIETVQAEVQRRTEALLDEFYPDSPNGGKPWGYLWAVVIHCDECGREFPLFNTTTLRSADEKKGDKGSSLVLLTSASAWSTDVLEVESGSAATMRPLIRGTRGKVAWCPYPDCGHAHELSEHKRLVRQHYDNLAILAVADLDGTTKVFRRPTAEDLEAPERARDALKQMQVNSLPARPDERLVMGSSRMMAVHYGATTFGDLSVDRQNLLHASIAGAICDIASELVDAGTSAEYASALAGYAGAVLSRKLKRSTRGARLQITGGTQVGDIFVNESSIGFNYDFFEAGLVDGPGTWRSVATTPRALSLLVQTEGSPALVQRGSALSLPYRTGSMDAVITDPPYDAMINYTDASDLFFVWLRRALAGISFDFALTSHPNGTQENAEEIIVSHYWDYTNVEGEHRTPDHYDSSIAKAFAETRRVVHDNGVVTIVFGHGDPDVWKRILDALSSAGLVLTGAWPANTEKGGAPGSANINTTLTLACRPAPVNRPDGRVAEVDAEMRRVIADRVKSVWGPSSLSYVDQKMAAAGPALEVVGRYERILDKTGQQVDLTRYLPLARKAVTEAHDLRFDSLPLGTFDAPTQFALEWARSYGRRVQAASEARWQRLAADLQEHETDGVLKDVSKGVRLIKSSEVESDVVGGSPLFSVALAAAARWSAGSLADAAAAIRDAGVDPADQHFWACINALSKALPETDPDGQIWMRMVRNRDAVVTAVSNVEAAQAIARRAEEQQAAIDGANPQLFADPDSLFGQEGN